MKIIIRNFQRKTIFVIAAEPYLSLMVLCQFIRKLAKDHKSYGSAATFLNTKFGTLKSDRKSVCTNR